MLPFIKTSVMTNRIRIFMCEKFPTASYPNSNFFFGKIINDYF